MDESGEDIIDSNNNNFFALDWLANDESSSLKSSPLVVRKHLTRPPRTHWRPHKSH